MMRGDVTPSTLENNVGLPYLLSKAARDEPELDAMTCTRIAYIVRTIFTSNRYLSSTSTYASSEYLLQAYSPWALHELMMCVMKTKPCRSVVCSLPFLSYWIMINKVYLTVEAGPGRGHFSICQSSYLRENELMESPRKFNISLERSYLLIPMAHHRSS